MIVWILASLLTQNTVTLSESWQRNLDDYDVYRTRALAVSDDGIIAMIDRDQGHVVLIDDRGTLIKRIAAKGQGPGELQRPVEIAYSQDDQTFVVLDFANSRLSKWDKNGHFVQEHPMPRPFFRPYLPKKNLILLTRDPFAQNLQTPTLLSFDIQKNSQTVLWQFQPKSPIVFSKIGDHQDAGEIIWRWNPALVFGASDKLIAVAFTSESQVHLLNYQGQPISSPIGVKLPKFPISASQVESAFDLMPANMKADLKAGLAKPDVWPAIRNILVDNKHRIWVFGSHPEVEAPHPFSVFSERGTALASGNIPALPLAAAHGGLYYLHGEEHLFLVKVTPKSAI